MKDKIKYWRDMRDGLDYVYTPARAGGAMVDIKMLTYDHEPYIRHAIESVLKQETQYPYRLFISDDHSTDRTAEIIREYQAKYPDKIATILWNYNTGLTGRGCNGIVLARHCKAKYIAVLEGDDYWTSPHKLEKSIAFLESHPEYIGYAHDHRIVDENENDRHMAWSAPFCEEYIYNKNSVVYRRPLTQTAAIINRNYMLAWPEDTWDDFYRCRMNGDWKRTLSLACLGNVYCSREIMSAYRLMFSGGSWCARTAGKNITLHNYLMWTDLADFAKKTYGVELDIEGLVEEYRRESREFLLRSFNFENLRIFLKLSYLNAARKKQGEQVG